MKRRWLIAILAVFLVVGAIVAFKIKQESQLGTLAETFRNKAIKETDPTLTAVQAKVWLWRNGFQIARFSDNFLDDVASELTEQTPQGEKKFNTIDGYRMVRASSLTYGEQWIYLTFMFEATQDEYRAGKFLSVEAGVGSPTPAFRHEFDRRAATSPTLTTTP